MKKTMPVLISFLMWLFIGTITIFVTIPIILYTLFFWWVDSSRRLQHGLSTFWGFWVTHLSPFWKVEIHGMSHFPKKGVFVAVSNHSSLADIILLYNLKRQFKWVSKESLFKIPFFGWGMHACGYIPLKRGVQTSIRDTYEKALYWLKKNITVMMFPEGTRSKEGHLGAFHNGAFKLALKAKVPVLPIVILGSKNIVQKGSWVLARKVHIRVFVLPPVDIQPYELDQFEKLKNKVRGIMEEKLAHG
ncbi:MAG: 1-acyl-sn-glycerol-3-phosphate acyltransferase [Candidatus Omnitrophica bacterium]|nr:1-acyl-sn-glycerol-3-phosphate acyltransferase [Candidatus Omnitrophota bacterium]